jgi:hypothetical protein
MFLNERIMAKLLISVMLLGSLIFLIAGILAVAPYWLFDAVSLLVGGSLGAYSFFKSNTKTALVLICWALFSACVQLGFLIIALILFNQRMNPFARFARIPLGDKGSSFVFCSIASGSINTSAAIFFNRFRAKRQHVEQSRV